MDPVSVGLLMALAGGAGGEAGRQAWAGLSTLVRRPFRGVKETSEGSPATSGEGELSWLEEAPADQPRAQALSQALAARAAADGDFRSDLGQWHEPAMTFRVGEGRTTNHISGGTFHGPAVLAENISGGLTFTTPASGSTSPPDGEGDRGPHFQ
ncbi:MULTISPECIES: hypothetical protein [Streptomyces]|uniref:Uncharacterized protein n=1 Tax=Streptomyces anthocyanicus TaxID=68174 RepID=A0ABZ1M885_9ACTN|nr:MULTISPECIES: hypothetical protein [Streptomyces]MBQ0949020.1 hypothetical protein [Streptomyces sp. RK76]MDX3315389.1 hypothetical protein [Streptomyces sp. ME03-5684b]WSB58789.1 hypothetical protein OIE72_00555 [Streptomyces anthocyanicus]WSB65880.1 hypothetical protein OIE72_38890 [Streptomyces anthocyanicus]WTC46291.1 hypothetical protein OG855_00450 [Streptomyces anthocyanicus]